MNQPDLPNRRRSPFEWSLAALRPIDGGAERPSFMYKAGQASRDSAVHFWRFMAVTGLVLSVGVGIWAFQFVQEADLRAVLAEKKLAKLEQARFKNAEQALPEPIVSTGSWVEPLRDQATLHHRREMLTFAVGIVPSGSIWRCWFEAGELGESTEWPTPPTVFTTPPYRLPAPYVPERE
jgi:hypothetical protein